MSAFIRRTGTWSGVYRMAAWRFNPGEVSGPFYSQRDLTDAIQAVVEDAPLLCLHCEKMRNED